MSTAQGPGRIGPLEEGPRETPRAALAATEDGAGQLTVEDCLCARAKDQRDQAIVTAAQAGASVRALGHAADIGKTQASEIARFGEAGWR